MTYPESFHIEAAATEAPTFNGVPIETMTGEELTVAQLAIDKLRQAAYVLRERLSPQESLLSSSVERRTYQLWSEAYKASQREIAKRSLIETQQSPMGRAALYAATESYNNPGHIYTITKQDFPLPKDSLASIIQVVVPELLRATALDGQRGDLEQEIDVPTAHVRGFSSRSSNALANQLIDKFHGTVSDLAVCRQEIAQEENDDLRLSQFEFLITKKPTGKPKFNGRAVVQLALPSNYHQEGASYRLLPARKSTTSSQRHYDEASKDMGWAVAADNIANPYSGGRVSPK